MTRVFLSADEIRGQFAAAMAHMYAQEVPAYAELLALVHDVNARVMDAHPQVRTGLALNGEAADLDVVQHGAVRVGTPGELSGLRRLFAVMGMHPVGYYDLAPAGVPVHSTAFRPIGDRGHSAPLRIFVSMLRLELIEDVPLRQRVAALLQAREVFRPRLLQLIDLAESAGGLDVDEAREFVALAQDTFRWCGEAVVGQDEYRKISQAHPVVADVACFKRPHINHLTPKTLDIDAAQQEMRVRSLQPKDLIEGPARHTPALLLRQTSFKARPESVRFTDGMGTHTARFGEIEQRGIALTSSGRALYEKLLTAVPRGAPDYSAALERAFETFPSDLKEIRQRGLAYFRYAVLPGNIGGTIDLHNASVEDLVEAAVVAAEPLTYEDFLPVSAAGIFRSNLGAGGRGQYDAIDSRNAFEAALGRPVVDADALYAATERESIEAVRRQLSVARMLEAREDCSL